jgi:hypothetical protein
MDPISIVVTALAIGGAAFLKATASQAAKDCYKSLKGWITGKYPKASVDLLEGDPNSKSRQDVVAEDLKKTDAGTDGELLKLAKALLDTVRNEAPEAAAAVGVDLERVQGASLEIERILSKGPGVIVKAATITGPIRISDVTAGGGSSTEPGKKKTE